MPNEQLSARFARFRKSVGLAQRELAQKLGVSPGTIGMIESGKNNISFNILRALSDHFGASADWLLYGIGEMRQPGFADRRGGGRIEPADRSRPASGDLRYDGEDFSFVRRMEVDVSAGHGLVPISQSTAEVLAYSRTWLLNQGINADLAGLVRVRGDSMAPAIPDGALVLVHLPEMRVERSGIFVFSLGEDVYIKRLDPVFSGGSGQLVALVAVSLNPHYPPMTIAGPDLSDLRIAGRVRGVSFSMT